MPYTPPLLSAFSEVVDTNRRWTPDWYAAWSDMRKLIVPTEGVWNATKKYSLDNTGEIDNAVPLAALQADLLAISMTLNPFSGSPGYAAGARPMPMVVFEPGLYAASAWPNFAINNLWMEGLGQVEFWYKGFGVNVFGDAFTFDGELHYGAGNGSLNTTFVNLRFLAVGTAADTMVLRSINHSRFANIRLQGASFFFPPAKVLNAKWLVCTNFDDLHISSFDNVTSVAPPNASGTEAGNYGVYIDELHFGSHWCSANVFNRAVIEGCEWGVYIKSGGLQSFNGGTIEGCGTAITIESPNAGFNNFRNIDIEVNSVADVNFMAGSHDNHVLLGGIGDSSPIGVIDNGTNNYVSKYGSDTNTPIKTSVSPNVNQATLDASPQDVITIANGGNAIFCPAGQGMLALVCNVNSTATILSLVGGGGVQFVNSNATWVDNTTTPGAGLQSLAYDGVGAYRLYNNTGVSADYKLIVLKPV